MRIFLDSSVILSACASKKSRSRLITLIGPDCAWELVSSACCQAETARNIGKFEPAAAAHWTALRDRLTWVPNALTTKRPLLLAASKDKPVLISALAARSKVLLTLDTSDFSILIESEGRIMKWSDVRPEWPDRPINLYGRGKDSGTSMP